LSDFKELRTFMVLAFENSKLNAAYKGEAMRRQEDLSLVKRPR